MNVRWPDVVMYAFRSRHVRDKLRRLDALER